MDGAFGTARNAALAAPAWRRLRAIWPAGLPQPGNQAGANACFAVKCGLARHHGRRGIAALLLVAFTSLPAAAQTTGSVGPSGLPLPRYVSLKSDRVNLRQGPGTDYPTAWVYRRAGLPVEVIEEYEAWRKVRDSEGTTGWILSSLLSGRRTALVLPWELKPDAPRPQIALRQNDSERAAPVAMIEAGVIADIQSCDGAWCYVVIESFRGYLEQTKLWGVYSKELVK